jgi:hypothetical protein
LPVLFLCSSTTSNGEQFVATGARDSDAGTYCFEVLGVVLLVIKQRSRFPRAFKQSALCLPGFQLIGSDFVANGDRIKGDTHAALPMTGNDSMNRAMLLAGTTDRLPIFRISSLPAFANW